MEKPQTVAAYVSWAKKQLDMDWSGKFVRYYETVSTSMRRELQESAVWSKLATRMKDLGAEYLLSKQYPLFAPNGDSPTLFVKPCSSVVEKSFRKNVLNNLEWPDPPASGWVTPQNFYLHIKDIVRTSITVKYLDGVELISSAIREVCVSENISTYVSLEARDSGYYAGHVDIELPFEVASLTWDTISFQGSIEVQITTQVKEVIRQLTHRYYEERRVTDPTSGSKQWQWDYKSSEFTANYLGHMLHYLEGMIMELRDRDRR